MKAAVCASTGPAVGGVTSGRISRSRRDVENEEIQMYFSKLKDLVPFIPRNKKLSRLDIIQYVIDYICDLQSALENHPAVNTFDVAAALSDRPPQGAVSPRQPLVVLSNQNTILGPLEAPVHQPSTIPEKLSPSDGRPDSC